MYVTDKNRNSNNALKLYFDVTCFEGFINVVNFFLIHLGYDVSLCIPLYFTLYSDQILMRVDTK
jgi:hypothetical protein